MAKPKTAKSYVEGIAFLCGNCNENLCEPSSGSHLWTVADAEHNAGLVVNCSTCGEDTRLPSTIRPKMP
jgi:hypothetical protein